MEDPKFWVAVSFVVFAFLAWRPLSRFIASALDKRADIIKHDLTEALRLREEAQNLLATFQRRQRDAMIEAEDIVTRAKSEADLMLHEAEKNLEEMLNKRIEIAMAKINQAETQAVQEIKSQAVDAAMNSAQNLIASQLGKSTSQELFQRSLKDIQKKLH
ncbi:F0F1 ATP synthase subunit B [bacterium]|nr:F0F1 ATP synthase subunit B [bacterium]